MESSERRVAEVSDVSKERTDRRPITLVWAGEGFARSEVTREARIPTSAVGHPAGPQPSAARPVTTGSAYREDERSR